uniref:Uncharacterized protein n=1 Tax=Varanus komodoensis TaxID=61221 RepID=A0A8D2LID5_VARKO
VTGQLYLLGTLDYEHTKSYHLTIILKDLDNDIDGKRQLTTLCNITISVQTLPKKPIILYTTEEYWAPDPWFVVVLTLTGALLLSVLGLLFWQLCSASQSSPFCCSLNSRKAPGEMPEPLLQNK